jgi:antitoxin (DNA-binding transcriptional repressor) of toxin-antitoxin stability system
MTILSISERGWEVPKMKVMAVTEFKAHALQVLGEVAERRERVLIMKRGRPLAEVGPFTEAMPAAGRLAETLVFETDIVSPLGEGMWDACT